MKRNLRKMLTLLLCVALITGAFPLAAFASHTCPDCDELIDGELYCHECYKCYSCCSGEICQNCERCTDCSGANMCAGGCGLCDDCVAVCEECNMCEDCSGYDICDKCSEEMGKVICIGCSIDENFHCPDCGECFFELGDWCDECGRCYNCVDKCSGCSNAIGHSICIDCAIEQGNHCPECDECYFEVGDWCDECGRCYNCVDKCSGCSDAIGHSICIECAIEQGNHCPGCEECYFEVGDWCDECGLCYNCVDKCSGCSSALGHSICVNCAIEQGLHCPQCDGCYEENGEYCSECGQCESCSTICTDCVSEGICIECAIDKGLHCGGCFACSVDAAICEGCGWQCSECADDFCEYCNLCSSCASTCPNCDHCAECAELCPECGEYCSECSDFCDDCGLCEECCKANAEQAGCDCDDWVCVQNSEWDKHYEELHSGESSAHTVKSSARWSFDGNYHWHPCCYCSDSNHYTSRALHTFDKDGKCTLCGYDKNAKIQIIQQPQDVTGVYVTDANSAEDVYKANTVHFEVKAQGNSALTYKWYCGHYNSEGELYKQYLNPVGDYYDTVDYEGPEITDIIPTDACYSTAYYFCVISDQDGNTVTTSLAEVFAKHYYLNAGFKNVDSKTADGHILCCVGEGCEECTKLQKHYDKNDDYICDACGWEMEHVLKQINIFYDDVYAAFQTGESVKDFSERIVNACRVWTNTTHASCSNNPTSTRLYHSATGNWGDLTVCSNDDIINSTDMYAVRLSLTCTMKDGTTLPKVGEFPDSNILCLNGVPLKYGEDYTVKTGTYKESTNADGQTVYTFDISLKLVPRNEQAYDITVTNGEAVSIVNPNSITKAFAGQTINLSTELDQAPNEGDAFSHWECTSDNAAIRNPKSMYNATFVMPAGNVSFTAVFTHVIPALTGKAAISGTTKFGETLTASLSSGNDSGVLSYQWLRNNAVISGASNSTYVLTAADIGKNIAVSITDSNRTGTITSERYLIAKADAPSLPTSLVAAACTTPLQNDGKITGMDSTMEYKKYGEANWTVCTDALLTGLAPGCYYVRYKETDTHEASAAAAVYVKKYALTFYAVRSGNTVTVTVCDLPINCTVFVGEYDAGGRMISAGCQTCAAHLKKSYTFTMNSTTSNVKCFLTADGFAPLTASITPTTH